jgi:hypothetical protein
MSDAIKALVSAQKAMGAVIKNANNPHLKSKYADLGSVLDACQTALHDNGFAVMQPCGKDDQGQFVETLLAHESGDSFSSRVYLVIGKNDMQGVGSAITYARRYGLLGMAGLAPEDDDGEATKAPKQPRQEPPPAVDDAAVNHAIDYLSQADSLPDLQERWKKLPAPVKAEPRVIMEKDGNKARLTKRPADDLAGDGIPEGM